MPATTVTVVRGHTRPVEHLRFDAAGLKLVSADTYGEMRVWDLNAPDIPSTTEELRELARKRLPAGIAQNELAGRLQTALGQIRKP